MQAVRELEQLHLGERRVTRARPFGDGKPRLLVYAERFLRPLSHIRELANQRCTQLGRAGPRVLERYDEIILLGGDRVEEPRGLTLLLGVHVELEQSAPFVREERPERLHELVDDSGEGHGSSLRRRSLVAVDQNISAIQVHVFRAAHRDLAVAAHLDRTPSVQAQCLAGQIHVARMAEIQARSPKRQDRPFGRKAHRELDDSVCARHRQGVFSALEEGERSPGAILHARGQRRRVRV